MGRIEAWHDDRSILIFNRMAGLNVRCSIFVSCLARRESGCMNPYMLNVIA